MARRTLQTAILILLAVASLGTTALIAMNVALRQSRTHSGTQASLRGGTLASPSAPEKLFPLPTFAFTDQTGADFGSAQLQGKVWIASFIFTSCSGPCPLITRTMANLQSTLRTHARWPDLRLISISVDPTNDTPEILRSYAGRFGADAQQWRFLTGTQSAVWKFTQEAFKLPVDHSNDPVMPILHSQKFVLIDGQGAVRGYYDALEDPERQRLLHDLDLILAEK